jgi:hypothetical protein
VQPGFFDGDDLRLVLVAHGQVQHQVHVRVQAQLGQFGFCADGFFSSFRG